MPPNRLRQTCFQVTTAGLRAVVVLGSLVALVAGQPARAQTPEATPIRSRSIELHYRVSDADQGAKVELWYTRDRGATWQRYGADEDGVSPFIFTAPAEGLYGIKLVISQPGASAGSSGDLHAPPAANEPPQRWIFVDYNPPLVQWDAVEADDNFAAKRIVHLRWTAYDHNLTARPVALAYQSSVDGAWQVIDGALPNAGRYDWTVPAEVAAQVSIKLTVSDMGGHSVERVYGPVPVERWMKAVAVTTRPAEVAATRPAADSGTSAFAEGLPTPADMEKRLKAQDLHRQGAALLQSGRYATAAERFREALEADPDLLVAQCDLAGIYYLQQDYPKALELYNAVLARDQKNAPAMRGASLAHVALKQYPQSRDMLKRLLAVREKDSQAWLDLGDVLFMMGETGGARNAWSRASTADATLEAVIRKANRRLELYGATGSEAAATGSR